MVHELRDTRRPRALQAAPGRCFLIGLTALLLLPCAARAQDPPLRSAQDIADSTAIAELARTLVAGLESDSARHAAIYEWTARHVNYDVAQYLRGGSADPPAEEVFRTRLAVCAGYVAIYARLAREAGLSVQRVRGYAKGFDYEHGQSTRRNNHDWLAVRLGGEWRLVDPTWGAGVVADMRYEPRFTWAYFLIDPESLILSHLPRDDAWQLLRPPMRRSEFERMSAIPRTLLDVGFPAAELRAAARAGTRDFPLVDDAVPALRVVRAPITGTLRTAAPLTVELIWPGAEDVAFITPAGIYTSFAQDGDRFTGETLASDGVIFIAGRVDGTDAYRTVLQYRVR